MANIIKQKANAAKAAKEAAENARDLSELRAAVVSLATYNENVEARLEKAEAKKRESSGG